MTIQIGPPGPDPTPANERPLDVCVHSYPYARIVRYAVTGWANLPETFRRMKPDQVIRVRSRNGKDQPQVALAAKKANVRIKVESRPFMDDILVTCLGPQGGEQTKAAPKPSKPKAPAAPKAKADVKTPKSRCFKNWKRDELFS